MSIFLFHNGMLGQKWGVRRYQNDDGELVLSNAKIEHSELMHHGILGQKWGIRHYQNEDGTLTDAGRKRYYKQLRKELRIKDPEEQELEMLKIGKELKARNNVSADEVSKLHELDKVEREAMNNWLEGLSKRRKDRNSVSDKELNELFEAEEKASSEYFDYVGRIANRLVENCGDEILMTSYVYSNSGKKHPVYHDARRETEYILLRIGSEYLWPEED